LQYLAFEFGSELASIDELSFRQVSLVSVFLPQSICSLPGCTFHGLRIRYFHFDRYISLRQMQSVTFSSLSCLSEIVIPGSVRHIHACFFRRCKSLRYVAFELPSQCWCIAFDAFGDCPLLNSLVLPPSVEIIDQTFSESTEHIPRYSAPDNLHFFVEHDCLTNGRDLIQYQGSSETFCVNRDLTALFPGSFLGNSTLTTITFECESRLKGLPDYCFYRCTRLHSVHIPKSVRVIGEHSFTNCSELAKVTFASPSTIHTIKSYVFSYCALLTDFRVPSSVSTIGSSVFSGCSGLSSLTFETPSHLSRIPSSVFLGCPLLKTLSLPDSLMTIDESAFDGWPQFGRCSKLYNGRISFCAL
jgi:hypothetical protein